MKIKELNSLNEQELQQKIFELRTDLIKDNIQVATGVSPKSSGKISKAKRTIARIKTILRGRIAKTHG